jgi:hypothetical protein
MSFSRIRGQIFGFLRVLESFLKRGYVLSMRFFSLICIVVFIIGSVGAFAQGEYLEKGQNGFGGEFRAIWSPDEFMGVELVTGYSIAGILDIGLDLGYTLGEISGDSSSELSLGFTYNVNILKQSRRVPLSLQVTGSYGLVNVRSDYLEIQNWERSATGYTIGVNLSRNFRLTSFWLLHLNGLVDYESFTYTTTDPAAVPPTPTTVQEYVRDLFFGGGVGFLFVFPKGQTLAIRAEVRADEDLELQIHPVIGAAFPQK